MLAAVENMPEDWDETELGWYLVHRAVLFTRTTDHLRRIAYNNALRSRGAVTGAVVALAKATLSSL
jgi:hypothetical protein